jgi:hypothetical protein
MANFLHSGDPEGYSINIDQIRAVKRDRRNGKATIIFAQDHTLELEGTKAKQFMDILTRLESEASRAWEVAKKDYPAA